MEDANFKKNNFKNREEEKFLPADGYYENYNDNGYIFSGNLINGKIHGKGKITYKNGNIAEGIFENGILHGKGKITYKNGNIDEGTFDRGSFIFGRKTLKYEGQLEGNFENNVLHGIGATYINDIKKIGFFVLGKLDTKKIYAQSQKDACLVVFPGEDKETQNIINFIGSQERLTELKEFLEQYRSLLVEYPNQNSMIYFDDIIKSAVVEKIDLIDIYKKNLKAIDFNALNIKPLILQIFSLQTKVNFIQKLLKKTSFVEIKNLDTDELWNQEDKNNPNFKKIKDSVVELKKNSENVRKTKNILELNNKNIIKKEQDIQKLTQANEKFKGYIDNGNVVVQPNGIKKNKQLTEQDIQKLKEDITNNNSEIEKLTIERNELSKKQSLLLENFKLGLSKVTNFKIIEENKTEEKKEEEKKPQKKKKKKPKTPQEEQQTKQEYERNEKEEEAIMQETKKTETDFDNLSVSTVLYKEGDDMSIMSSIQKDINERDGEIDLLLKESNTETEQFTQEEESEEEQGGAEEVIIEENLHQTRNQFMPTQSVSTFAESDKPFFNPADKSQAENLSFSMESVQEDSFNNSFMTEESVVNNSLEQSAINNSYEEEYYQNLQNLSMATGAGNDYGNIDEIDEAPSNNIQIVNKYNINIDGFENILIEGREAKRNIGSNGIKSFGNNGKFEWKNQTFYLGYLKNNIDRRLVIAYLKNENNLVEKIYLIKEHNHIANDKLLKDQSGLNNIITTFKDKIDPREEQKENNAYKAETTNIEPVAKNNHKKR